MTTGDLPRDDLAAAIGSRRELGADYDQALVEGFLSRVERDIDQRVDQRLAHRGIGAAVQRNSSLALPLASLGIGVPLSAIAGGIGHLPGLIVAWVGIVGVNVANTLGTRHERRDR